jgi:hypothetical protein
MPSKNEIAQKPELDGTAVARPEQEKPMADGSQVNEMGDDTTSNYEMDSEAATYKMPSINHYGLIELEAWHEASEMGVRSQATGYGYR